jgi:hypothetical protein
LRIGIPMGSESPQDFDVAGRRHVAAQYMAVDSN